MQDSQSSPSGGGTPFPKRFYQAATIEQDAGGFGLRLDGRPARTPARNLVVLPTAAAAAAVAEEWAAVAATVDPRLMPMTRLVNSVIDGVAQTQDAVRAEIVRYAGSDLLVYRADSPPDLVRTQQAAWDPVLAWSRASLGADLRLGRGVMFVAQPPAAIERLEAAMSALTGTGAAAPFRLGALHVMTALTGSALLALAVLAGHLTAAEAWSAAHVDEDHQIAQWGADEEAMARRSLRWIDMDSAARLTRLIASDSSL
jgi:chaperone required for assembly of F1-ATPase